MKKWIIAILGVLMVAGTVGFFSLDKDQRALIAHLPTDRNVLFWSVDQRDAAFRAMDAIPI